MAATITVEGMSCGHCERTVEDALRGVDGVTDASADRGSKRAHARDGAADPIDP